MTDYTLPAVVRPEITKTARNKFRQTGFIIANLHGRGASESLALNEETWTKYLRTMHKGEVLEIDITGGDDPSTRNELVRIQDISRTPLNNRVLHIDFMRLERAPEEEYELPLSFTGIARGIKDGGIIDQIRPTVRIICYPAIKPKAVSVNVVDLKLGDTLLASQVTLPSRVRLAIPGDTILVTCYKAPVVAEEEEAAPAADPAPAPAPAPKKK